MASTPSAEAIAPAADPHTDAAVAAELAALRPVAPARPATDPVLAIAPPGGAADAPPKLAGSDVGTAGAAASGEASVHAATPATSAAFVTSDSASASPPAATAADRAIASDDDDLRAVTRSPLASALALVTGSRRHLAIAGGAVLLLVVVVAIAAGSGGKKKPASSLAHGPAAGESAVPARPTRASAVPAPAHEPIATNARVERDDEPTPSVDQRTSNDDDDDDAREPLAGEAATKPTAATRPDPATRTASPTATTATTATTAKTSTAKTATASRTTVARTTARSAQPAPAPARATAEPARATTANTLGGKPIVLEYDEQAKDLGRVVPTATRDDQIAIQRARAAYVTGTQRLRSGDGGGAVTYFKQSLAHYPGYVAGYRGLGLAYEKQGDPAKAAQALRTYVGAAPGARDASPLRTRIATLSSQRK